MTPLESPQKARETVTEIPEEIVEAARVALMASISAARNKTAEEAVNIIATALHEAVKAEREKNAWQPIDTAPKDGTRIMLVGGVYHGFPFSGYWDFSPYSPDSPWTTVVGRHTLYEHCPTHWMPLPSAPKSEGA
jgi:hypothetical protein